MTTRIRRRLAASLAVSTALFLGACSSGGDATSGNTDGPATSERDIVLQGLERFPALLAQARNGQAASGSPVRVGFVTMERGSYVYKTMADSAANAVRFLNTIGGIKGHPIELVRCGTDASPESSQNCATQMVNSDVVAVGQGVDFNMTAVLKALEAVGGSTFGGDPLFDTERSATNANYYFSNFAYQVVGSEFAVRTLGAKRIAIISSDSASGISLSKVRAQEPIGKLGATADVFTVSSSASDFSAVATKALGYDAVVSNLGGLGCSGVPLALHALGFQGALLNPDSCNNQADLTAMGPAGDGIYSTAENYSPFSREDASQPASAEAELALYVAENDRTELPQGGLEQYGFSQLINFAEALASAPDTTYTMAAVTKILANSRGANFTAADYDCSTTAIAKYPAYCAVRGGVYQWDGEAMTPKTEGLIVPTTVS